MPKGIYQHKKGQGGRKGRSGVYKRTKYHREIISKAMIGNTNGFQKGGIPQNKDKKCPQITKAKKGKHYPKIGKALKGHPVTKEARKKMASKMKGRFAREKHWNWKGGTSFEPYSLDWTPELRQSIRKRDNFICQRKDCGKYPALSVHHVDYNKKNCKHDNLITLCKSCNSKVNINREYWENYFQVLIK